VRYGKGTLRLIMLRADATAAGLKAGEQRRSPTADDLDRWTEHESPGVREAFWTGFARGRQRAANLQQLEMEIA
jgi:hypothetical protein